MLIKDFQEEANSVSSWPKLEQYEKVHTSIFARINEAISKLSEEELNQMENILRKSNGKH